MPEIIVNIEIWCSCGRGLCNQSYEKKGGIQVEPCEHCLEKARAEGHDEGWDKGYEEGHAEGYKKAYEEATKLLKESP